MTDQSSSNFTLSEKQGENEVPKKVKISEKERTCKSDPVYTVDDAIEKMGFGPFQMIVFFFCGLLWTADAMEVMILSILSPAVKCQWDLSSAEEAIITSIVFAGSLIGSLCWGTLGDNFGRKTSLFCSTIVVLVSGVLSALKLTPDDARYPGYPWMLICRFGVGFGASGITQVGPYYIEFLPLKLRALCTTLVSGWWTIGTMFGAALAVGVMRPGSLGWHWYLGLCAIPAFLSLFYFPFIPESARYYLVHGKIDKAEKVLRRVAWFNSKSLPEGRLITNQVEQDNEQNNVLHGDSKESNEVDVYCDTKLTGTSPFGTNEEKAPLLIGNGTTKKADQHDQMLVDQEVKPGSTSKLVAMVKSLPLLFRSGMWKVTFILSFLWFGSAWLYYGNVLLTSTILQENPHCEAGLNTTLSNDTEAYNGTCEHELDIDDYLKIMWTTGAELPGILITVLIIEFIGRKLTMAFNFAMILLGFCLLFICTTEVVLTFFLFLIRAFTTGVFKTMYVYTPEVYPTKVRGIGMAVLYSVARVGAIVTPYVAQVLFITSDYATISLYAGSSLILIVLSLLLPIETKGKLLRDE